MEPVRILHVVTTMDFGGVETLLMELYRNMDRKKVQFDFLCHNKKEGKYCDEIEKLGGRLFSIKSVKRSLGAISYKKNLKKFLMAHPEYRIIHCHINAYNGYVLQVAKQCSVPVRISHSHVSEFKMHLLRDFYRIRSMRQINGSATNFFACSKDAAQFIYRDKIIVDNTIVFNNAIDTEKFRFCQESRTLIRKQYAIEDRFVFAHVGRFMEEKNHHFIIEIFSEIVKQLPDAVLMLLGEGPLEKKVHVQVESLGIQDRVIFVGSKANVNDYLSASDAFLFPSLFEGLGIVAVEAQCSGLPTFASDRVPKEAKRTDLLQFIPLDNGAKAWSERIVLTIQKTHTDEYLNERLWYASVVKDSGYDILDKAKWLEHFYLSHWENRDGN